MKGYESMTRRLAAAAVCVGLTLGLSGCMHVHRRPKLPVLPPVLVPIELETLPPPTDLPMVAAPELTLPPIPIAAAAATPRRERRRIAPKAAAATPEETAPEPMPDTVAIGELTAGGATDPQAQQEATDLILSIEKRLNGLPVQMQKRQRAQISRVRNFWRQAKEALNSGDTEGAKTLAIKAKLLLDDMEKQGGRGE
ncbi:MAG: hypothetical protein ABI158_10425 [Edaphobacter sp.]